MEIVGEMQNRDELVSCQDVVTWLCAACTSRGGGGTQNTLPSVLNTLYPIYVPPEVYRYVTSKVQADLPALAQPTGVGGGPGAEALTGALRAPEAARGDAAGAPPRG